MREYTVRSFDDFVTVIFEPNLDGAYGTPWYDDADIPLDDETCADYYIQLFSSPSFLFERFSPEQLSDGFGSMIDCNFPLSIYDLVWDGSVALWKREELIQSMVPLFSLFFARMAFASATYMWWDVLAFDYTCGNAYRGRSDAETRLQDAMFSALRAILQIDSEACLNAALHGLGHLRHPETGQLIASFLEANPTLPDDIRQYALAAAAGRIQ